MLLYMPSKREEPFACPIGEALWLEYRRRNPHAPKVPPEDLNDCTAQKWPHTWHTPIPAMIATRFDENSPASFSLVLI